ncbi:hypothetical protein [Neokomagataea tanensis]|nr:MULTISPECIES: hypothetical protein [Neokomagataea]
MTSFIDEQRQTYDIGSLCKLLPIAPPIYYARRFRQGVLSARV